MSARHSPIQIIAMAAIGASVRLLDAMATISTQQLILLCADVDKKLPPRSFTYHAACEGLTARNGLSFVPRSSSRTLNLKTPHLHAQIGHTRPDQYHHTPTPLEKTPDLLASLNRRSVPKWKIIVGGHQLSALSQDVQIRSIKSYTAHENYNPRIEAYDIALIELSSSVEYNDYVQPACLPNTTMNINIFHPCYISGWGVMAEKSAETADILQEAKVNQVDPKRCNSSQWYNGVIWDYNLCAGYEEGGIDSCQGDSGGPLMCLDEVTAKYYVTGVTSWGSGCAQSKKPGVYTNTQYFLEWFQEKLTGISSSTPPPKVENIPRTTVSPKGESKPRQQAQTTQVQILHQTCTLQLPRHKHIKQRLAKSSKKKGNL
ncbi:acrosin-like isoform X1 [Dendropsophus ebraccatus]|uniref:acrosin-like isoform X1 n=1 Tax=Dendropsophus ebraccatus TaxID=150705 RepID=UPI003831A098